MYPSFVRPSSSMGYKYMKERCAVEEAFSSQKPDKYIKYYSQ